MKETIGIISAMSNELNLLLSMTKVEKSTLLGGATYYEGKLEGHNVVLVQGGIGKCLSAVCSTMLIERFQATKILFTGVAGGVGDEVKIMDVVIANQLLFHDFGTISNESFIWNQLFGEEAGSLVSVDAKLAALALTCAQEVVGEEHAFTGIVATGDQVVASEIYVEKLSRDFHALACEMEGASVARVAEVFGIPCCVIRCISDKADGLAHNLYHHFVDDAANTSASIVKHMLQKL